MTIASDNGATTLAGASSAHPARLAQSARTRIQDVGRDPYFLAALQAASPANPVLPGQTPAISGGVLNESPNGTDPLGKFDSAADEMSQHPMNRAQNSQIPLNASGTPDSAKPVVGGKNEAPMVRVVISSDVLRLSAPFMDTLQIHSAAEKPAVGSAQHPVDGSGFQQAEAIWHDQRISIYETESGTDILARNYFLDATQRRALIQHLLNALAAIGKHPQRLTLNGELVWHTAQPSDAEAPAPLNQRPQNMLLPADRSN